MKNNKFLILLCLLFSIGFLTQCEKYGENGGPKEPDEETDRPPWAGGNTGENPHINKNDDSGTTRGGDYGDLYVIQRNEYTGVPDLIEVAGEYYVIPLDEEGNPLQRYTDVQDEGAAYELETTDEELWGELVTPLLVQEVDFGRLNIVRSPESVLDQAYAEALKVLNATGAEITLDFCGRLTSTYPDPSTGEILVKTIDSPRENMAIYRTIMRDLLDGTLSFLTLPDPDLDPLMVAAACFAAGSDKTGFVDVDEVVYVNGFINCYGNNEIENTNELDFEGQPKLYYNFYEPIGGADPFTYDRYGTFNNRYIQFLVWGNEYFPVDENGDSGGPVFTVWEVFETDLSGEGGWQGTGAKPQFSGMWGELNNSGVQAFANAVDDAVQVLDFVHGDSNIRFLPGYTPPE